MGGKWYVKQGRRMTNAERTSDYKKRNPERVKSNHLKWKYGITLDEWRSMFEAQNYRCAICKTDAPTGSGWHTDHNHSTGAVRGILCNDCNLGIGRLKDDPDLCEEASKYLRRDE